MTKQTTRDLIIQVVNKILATESEEAVSLRRVAYEIGKTVPTMYNYFRDKQSMIQTAREADAQEIDKILSIRVPENASIEMKILIASENIADYCFKTDKSLWRILTGNRPGPALKLVELLRDYLKEFVEAHHEYGISCTHALYRYIAILSGELEWFKACGAGSLPASFASEAFGLAFPAAA